MLVVGVGNACRGDDVAGLLVARRLRERVPPGVIVLERHGDLVGLLDDWVGADSVVLVDAMASGAPVGTILRVDARTEQLPTDGFRSSTRAFGVTEAFALGRLLRVLPRRLILYGIEGDDFTTGAPLSPLVEAAVNDVVERILREEIARPVRSGPAGAFLFGRSGPR